MSKNSSPIAIAIIGGGFSGVMVAVHLLKLAQNPLEIQLIERQPLVGRGRAYGGDSASYLLNVPAGKMSAFAQEPDHFLNWLKTKPELTQNLASGVKAETFIPRHIYGKYIEAVLETAAIASNCAHLERICDEATSIRPDAEGATIYLSSDRTLQADKIVLALGNFPPSDPPLADPSFYKSPRYIRDARSDAALAGLSADDSILLLGSGLTAVDIAIALRDSNHRGKIHAVSRRGLLPQAHKLSPPASPFLSPDTAPKTIRSLLNLIRRQVRAARSRGQDWQPTIDSLRPISQQLWQNLPLSEQRRFLRHLRPYWEVHRHRTAPEIEAAIAQMQQSKQLTVHAGCILTYRETSDGVEVLMRDRHTKQQTIFTVNRVINCTGSESDCRKLQHPLTANLREQGLIRPDRLLLGLDTASNGALVSTEDAVSKLLYTLGPPRKGSLWETTAVAEIRLQAANLASELIS